MTIEAGCRMGICGADPVAIKDGMDCLVGDLRRREGDARAARLRRQHPHGVLRARHGPVSVALTPDKAEAPSLSKVHGFTYDKSRRAASS